MPGSRLQADGAGGADGADGADGDTTIVTEVFDCTEAAQVIRDAVEDGRSWVPAMQQTLARLAAIVE